MALNGQNNEIAVILMTACVCPNGTAYTALQDSAIRKSQYLEAIDYYLQNTAFKIVFCENSGVDLWDEILSEKKHARLEYITFNGNDYNKEFGKGYGESKIIQYAILNSQFLKNTSYIIKITGRVKVLNINDISASLPTHLPKKIIKIDFSSDQGRISSVCFLASKNWLYGVMEKYGERIRDDGEINFEGALYIGIVESPHLVILRYNPLIVGVSAGSNMPYRNHNEIEHKRNHYHILCSIYKARKDWWHLFLFLVVLSYYSILSAIVLRIKKI